jgi:hypothetical protein
VWGHVVAPRVCIQRGEEGPADIQTGQLP